MRWRTTLLAICFCCLSVVCWYVCYGPPAAKPIAKAPPATNASEPTADQPAKTSQEDLYERIEGEATEKVAEQPADTFKWFSTLGYPDVKDKPFVKVALGHPRQRSETDPPENTFTVGFLLKTDGDKLEILTLGRRQLSLTKTALDTPDHLRVGVEDLDLVDFVTDYLRSKKEAEKSANEDEWPLPDIFFSRRSQELDLFTLAWACWRKDHKQLALDLKGSSIKQTLAKNLAYEEIWSATLDFQNLEIPRAALLARFERFLVHFPNSEYAKNAKELIAGLQPLIKEDEAHAAARKKGPAFDKLSTKEKVAELIFQLRDQCGQQWSDPGSCDIFSCKEGSPAHQLVDIGYDAVPQLIEALDDQQLTRSLGHHRSFYYSHYVLRVGDAAEQVLSEIAGQHFFQGRTTTSTMLRDREQGNVKKKVEAWYAEIQKKGEKQLLLDEVANGTDKWNFPFRLVKKYQGDEVIDAIEKGIEHTNNGNMYPIVTALGQIPGDKATEVLLRTLNSTKVAARYYAAVELHKRKRREAIEAMILEWRTLPDVKYGDPYYDTYSPGRTAIGTFLARTGDKEALEALGKLLAKETVGSRHDILTSFNQKFVSEASEDAHRAMYGIMATAMDDVEQGTAWGTFGGKNYSQARTCDMAAHILFLIDAKRFPFDLEGTLAERDARRAEIKKELEKLMAEK